MGGWGKGRGGGGGGGGGYGGGSRVTTFKIFLSGLPDGFKNSDLEPMFEAFGRTIECEVFRNNFAFVHMEEEECGRAAIKALNGSEIDQKKISVVESKNNEGPNIMKMKLSVKNIPKSVTASDIRSLFKKYGRVLEAEVSPNGNGSVTLEATGDIRSAINEMNGYMLGTQQLIVEPVKINPKAMAQQAAASSAPPGYSGGGGSGGGARGGRQPASAGRGMGVMSKRGGRMGGAMAAPVAYYEEEDYYPPQQTMLPRRPMPEYALGEREYYETPQRPQPLLRPPQRRAFVQQEYYEDQEDDYYAPPPVATRGVLRKPPPQQQYYEGYEDDDEGYAYDESGYYAGQGAEQYDQGYPVQQPPRKVAKGEPYPPPPVPPAGSIFRTPKEARRDMYIAARQFAAAGGDEKRRGERGGRNKLTAGKKAYIDAMKAVGLRLPPGHIPSLLDVRATFGPRPGHQQAPPKPRSAGAGMGAGAAPSPNMMPIARRFAAPHQRPTGSGAIKSLQQMAMGNSAMSTSYPLPLFPSAKEEDHSSAIGGYETASGMKDAMEQEYFQMNYSRRPKVQEGSKAQRNPDIDFTADIMLF